MLTMLVCHFSISKKTKYIIQNRIQHSHKFIYSSKLNIIKYFIRQFANTQNEIVDEQKKLFILLNRIINPPFNTIQNHELKNNINDFELLLLKLIDSLSVPKASPDLAL